MFKKPLKLAGSFALILMVAFAVVGIGFNLYASKYLDAATPYLEQNMPAVVSWDFERLKPLLTPESRAVFETEQGQRVYKMFSKLGRLTSLDAPKFLNAKAGVALDKEPYEVINFSILGHFEAGDVEITLTLVTAGDSYQIDYINMGSDAFLAPPLSD